MSVISRLQIENVKRVLSVTIHPDPNSPLVVIGGMNGNGKSSILDSISYLFCGEKLIPEEPIRRGARAASIEAELSPDNEGVVLVLRRKFTTSGSTLEVFQKTTQGVAKLQSPQALLNSLYSRISFDPELFRSQKPSERLEVLKRLAGVDTTEIDRKIAEVFDSRAVKARDLKAIKARLDSMPSHGGIPDEEIGTEEIMEPIAQARAVEGEKSKCKARIETLKSNRSETLASIDRASAEIKRLQNFIELQTKNLAKIDAEETGVAIKLESLSASQFSLEDLKSKLVEVQETNKKVRENKAKLAVQRQETELAESLRDSEKSIAELRLERESMIKNASWPIPGLGVDGDCVTWNGLPYEQASDSEQLKIATAIGFAMNPGVRVCLIRRGSLLDHMALEAIESVARDCSGQVFVERVSEGEECTVIMREGEAVDASGGTLP